MRPKIYTTLLVLALILMAPHPAMALLNLVHQFSCQKCHLQGYSFTDLSDNVCLQCHNSLKTPIETTTRGTASINADFASGDASNRYNHNAAAIDQTSHNWSAPATNPAAGAAEPLVGAYPGLYSKYGASAGKVACSRCHNPHGDYVSNKKLMPLKADKITPLTPNELCLACHKAFGDAMASDHGKLSHPIVATYDGTKPGYKAVSATYNSASPYVNGVQLVGGGVSCLSCHNAHFTDSNAGTGDGPASTDLGTGDGLMLRGDGLNVTYNASATTSNAPGVYPTGTSICAECHDLATATHGPSGKIGCLACHGGHNYNNGMPTFFMLNDPSNAYAQIGSDTLSGAALGEAWGGTDSTKIDGFCETCHGELDTDFGGNDGGVGHSTLVGQDCSSCHVGGHANGSFSKPEGCTGCHGSPPIAGDASGNFGGGPDGYADDGGAKSYYNAAGGVYKAEESTPHGTHALSTANGGYGFVCATCHNPRTTTAGTTATHLMDTFQDVMNGSYTYLSITDGYNTLVPAYATSGSGSCSNVYCHSNGGENNGDGTRNYGFPYKGYAAAPIWGGGNNTIYNVAGTTRCESCHGNDSLEMASATHDTHLNAGYTCKNCHLDTALSSTALTATAIGGTHVNGTVDVKFDTVIKGGNVVAHGANPYSNATTMNCSAVYCHSSGQDAEPAKRVYNTTILWSDTLPTGAARCDSCHKITAGTNQSVAHAAHVKGSTSNVGRDLDCYICHDLTMDSGSNIALGAGGLAYHANGKVEVDLKTALDSGTCTTVSCHSDGNLDSASDFTGTANPKDNTPSWTLAEPEGTPNSFSACDKCHGDDATDKAYPAYANGVAGSGDTNSHQGHFDGGIKCEECHVKTSVDGTALNGTDKTVHVNQKVDVLFKQTGNPYNAALTAAADETCSATYCHGSGSPVWGGIVNCGDCHKADSDLAGAHSGHWSLNTEQGSFAPETNLSNSASYKVNCGVCHAQSQGVVHAGGIASAKSTAQVMFNAATALVVNGNATTYTAGTTAYTDSTFNYSDATCANLYCHGNFAAPGGNGNNATPKWNSVTSGDCGTCHDVAASVTMDGGSHQKHVMTAVAFDCDLCHDGTAAAGVIVDKSLHVNQALNMNLKDADMRLGASATYNSANVGGSAVNNGTVAAANVGKGVYGTCDSIYCHSTVQGSSDPTTAATYKQPTWGGSVACGDCHGGQLGDTPVQSSGSHTQHVAAISGAGYEINCVMCHKGAGSGTSVHADYAINVNLNTTTLGGSASYNGATSMAKTPGNAYKDCTNVYCHSDGYANPGYTYNTVTWGTASEGDCGTCHGTNSANQPSSPFHSLHLRAFNNADAKMAGYRYACATCHNTTVTTTADATIVPAISSKVLHVNQQQDVAFNSFVNAGTAYDNTSQVCANLYCHSQGTSLTVYTGGNAPNRTPDWDSAGIDGGAAVNCDGCHGSQRGNTFQISSNAHKAHYNNASLVGYDVRCSSCHQATMGFGTGMNVRIPKNHVDKNVNVKWDFDEAGFKTSNGYIVKDADAPTYRGSSAASTVANGAVFAVGGTPGSCNNVYCHSYGNLDAQYNVASIGGGEFKSIAWNAGSVVDCASCHGDGTTEAFPGYPSGAPGSDTANSHYNHASVATSAIGCNVCHNETVATAYKDGDALASATLVVDGKHLNRTEDVAFAAAINGTYNGITLQNDKTCAATYCHGTDNSPAWGTPGPLACDSCHNASKSLAGTHAVHYNNAALATSASFTPSNDATVSTYAFSCGVCHQKPGIQHAQGVAGLNQSAQVSFNSAIAGSGAYTPGTSLEGTDAKGREFTAGQCDNLYCHSNGNGSAGNQTPLWNTALAGVDTCTACHDNSTAGATMATGKHTDHVNTATIMPNLGCAVCHSLTVDSNTHISDKRQHVDGGKDVAVSTYNSGVFSYTAGSKTCQNVYCHSDGKASPTTDAVNWSMAGPADCQYCHGGAGGSLGARGTGNALSTPHSVHTNLATFAYNCETCHTATAANSSTISDTSKHINKAIDVAVNSSTFGGDGSDYASGSCATTNCHGAGDAAVTWTSTPGSQNAGDCTLCHGMAASVTDGRDTSGATSANDPEVGAHVVHLNTTYNITRVIGCDECHTVPTGATYKDRVLAAGHIDSALPAELPLNGTIANSGTLNATYDFGASTCSNVYCHDSSQFQNGGTWSNGSNTTPKWNSVTYLDSDGNGKLDVADCQTCHGYPPAGGHPAAPSGCSGCHDNVRNTPNNINVDIFYNSALHVDGIVQGGGDSCTDCHSSGTLSSRHDIHTDYGSLLVGKAVSTNDYGKASWWYNVATVGGVTKMACGQCHWTSATVGAGNEQNHPDGVFDLEMRSTVDTTIPSGNIKEKNSGSAAWSGTTMVTSSYDVSNEDAGSCSGVYCHSNGYDSGSGYGYVTSPRWYANGVNGSAASFSGDKCANCHGNSPDSVGVSTGAVAGSSAHSLHEIGIHTDDLYDDDGSGLMAQGGAVASGAAHGDATTATTLSCNICHSDTVKVAANDKDSNCATCHTSGNSNLKGNLVIAATSTTHLNGTPDIVFNTATFKSRTQLRNDIESINVGTDWNRVNGYKNTTTLSYDQMALAATYNGINQSNDKTCSATACHSGIKTPAWNSGSDGNCLACHTELPK